MKLKQAILNFSFHFHTFHRWSRWEDIQGNDKTVLGNGKVVVIKISMQRRVCDICGLKEIRRV